MGILGDSLRRRREALGLNALEMARAAGCPVEVLLMAEFGVQVPMRHDERRRLAAAYGLGFREYLRLAFDEAERFESQRPA